LILLALVAFVGVASFLTVFMWRWAVRRPVPAESVPGTSEEKPISYAAIGASDVVGAGADDPTSQSWVNVLHGMMPPGTRLTRLGRGGITLHEALAVEVPQALAAQPDIVTMWNCVNDVGRGIALNDYLRDLDKALSLLTRETDANIYLLNVPDLSILLPPQGDPTQRQLIQGGARQWNQGIAATAAKFRGRVHVVDILPISAEVLARPDYLSSDGFHPSTSGYRRLAEVVWEAIREK
jgi:acyl-CoA thioesterase-1